MAPNVEQHTIRSRNGGFVEVAPYGYTKAIRAMCMECMGWESDPVADCTSPNCPLFPFRGKSSADIRVSPEEQARRREVGKKLSQSRHGKAIMRDESV